MANRQKEKKNNPFTLDVTERSTYDHKSFRILMRPKTHTLFLDQESNFHIR